MIIHRFLTFALAFVVFTPQLTRADDKMLQRALLEDFDGTLIGNHPEKAIELCSAILKNKDKSEEVTIIKALHARARAFIRCGRHTEAINDADELCNLLPRDADMLILKACVLAEMGRLDDALGTANKAIEVNPKSSRGSALIANVLGMQGKLDQALVWINKALALDKKNADAYQIRANILIFIRKYESCIEDLNRRLELQPLDWKEPERPYALRGMAFLALDRPQEAIESFAMARRLNPSNLVPVSAQSYCYARLGKWFLAGQAAQDWIRLAPKDPNGHIVLAKALAYMGNAEDVKKEIRLALEGTGAKNEAVLGGVGQVYALLEQFDEALAYYNKAIEIGGKGQNTVLAIQGKAKLLSSCPNGKYRDGPEALKLAEVLQSFDCDGEEKHSISLLMGQAYAECNNFEQAIVFAKRALEIAGPESISRDQYQKMIKLFESQTPYRTPLVKASKEIK